MPRPIFVCSGVRSELFNRQNREQDLGMISRRIFIRNGALLSGSGVLAGLVPSAWAQVVGSNDAIRLGIIGLGIKGAQLAKVTSEMEGVRLVALCDVDPRRLAEQVAIYGGGPTPIFASTDMRAVFDRPDVDAVIIATCTHWHALATLWACQAGKDVYVEKPVSHNIVEGRRMIEAVAATGRLAPLYRSVNSYPHLLPDGIETSPDRISDADLATAARPVLDAARTGADSRRQRSQPGTPRLAPRRLASASRTSGTPPAS